MDDRWMPLPLRYGTVPYATEYCDNCVLYWYRMLQIYPSSAGMIRYIHHRFQQDMMDDL